MPSDHVGPKIKQARERLGWSVADLAASAKIKLRTLEDIENEVTKEPGYAKVMAALDVLSRASGEPLISLLGGRIPGEALTDSALAGLKQETKAKRNREGAQMLGAKGQRVDATRTLADLREIVQHPERFDSLYVANVLAARFLDANTPEAVRGLALSLLSGNRELGQPYAAELAKIFPKLNQKSR